MKLPAMVSMMCLCTTQCGIMQLSASYVLASCRYHPDKNPGDEAAATMFQKVRGPAGKPHAAYSMVRSKHIVQCSRHCNLDAAHGRLADAGVSPMRGQRQRVCPCSVAPLMVLCIIHRHGMSLLPEQPIQPVQLLHDRCATLS